MRSSALRRRQGLGARPLRRSKGGTPTYEAADVAYLGDKLERGFDRAIYVLGADHHATARWYAAIARMLGYDPSRVEVLLYQLVHLTRGGEAAKMSKRARQRRLPRRAASTRSASTLPAGTSSTAAPTRRSRSTSTSPRRSREEPGLLRPVRPRADRGDPPQRRRRAEIGGPPPGPLAAEEKELVKRLAEFPVDRARGDRAARPAAIPAYAIRLADDFHRFYHAVPRARRPGAVLPPRALPRDAARDRPLPRPRRRRGTGADVMRGLEGCVQPV